MTRRIRSHLEKGVGRVNIPSDHIVAVPMERDGFPKQQSGVCWKGEEGMDIACAMNNTPIDSTF